MKVIYRIPAKVSFGYVEIEGEISSAEDALEEYERIIKFYNEGVKEGLPNKEFDVVLDKYLCGQGMDSEKYAKMSRPQIELVQTIKRSLARIKSRNN